MALFKSLVDSLVATTPISTAALGTAPFPNFVGSDALAVPPGGFGTIYAFGDSLSDAGNVSLGTLGIVPAPPYSNGRFSNGNVWVQDLARNLGLPPVKASLAGGTDYAYGGAETGTTAVHTANSTDLPAQLGQFAVSVRHPSPNALYTVWAGSNDVRDIANAALTPAQQQADVLQAVTNETSFIKGLAAHGAKDVVVLNLPDLGKTPYETARPATDASASALSRLYNADLAASLHQIMTSGAASIDLIDVYTLLNGVIANPVANGFTNVTQPVWTGTLADPHSGVLNASGAAQNGYLFFDDLHPTAAGHALLASAVTQSLIHPV